MQGCLPIPLLKEVIFTLFEKIYKVNVFGLAELTRQLLPKISPKGHVVNISSMGGIQGSAKFPGLSIYSSSKGAVITLTELWAEEFKETGPRFNALALGAVQTEMLAEAFPGFQAPVTADEFAHYLLDFGLNGHRYLQRESPSSFFFNTINLNGCKNFMLTCPHRLKIYYVGF